MSSYAEKKNQEFRDRAFAIKEKRDLERGLTQPKNMGPGSPGAPEFDSTGRPIGAMPAPGTALAWQYEADRRTEQRRQALWGDAQNVMRQGTDLMQTYRPGGSAALASGMYQNRGAMYANQSMATETPDLLMRYREKAAWDAQGKAEQAERDAKREANKAMALQIVGTVAGAAVGGVGGAALGAVAGGLAQRNAGGGPSLNPSYNVGGSQPGGKPSYQVGVSGVGGGMPGASPGQVGGGGGGGGGPGERRGAGSSSGGVGNEKGGAGGLESGSGLQTQDDGGGPMSMFSSQEAAYNAMLANQGGNERIYSEWAGSPVRSESTMMRIKTSLLRMQSAYNPA